MRKSKPITRKVKAKPKTKPVAKGVKINVKKARTAKKAKVQDLRPADKVKLALRAIKASAKSSRPKTVTPKEAQILKHRIHAMSKAHRSNPMIDIKSIKQAVQNELGGFGDGPENRLTNARKKGLFQKIRGKNYILTGVPGFDNLLIEGIPKGGSVIVAGGTGSGKTIFLLQIMNNLALAGKKCLYMSFEESPVKLKDHMTDFGWDPAKLEKKGLLKIQRFSPFDITRSVEGLLAKAKGELLIDIDPLVLPKGFTPDFIFLDSLTAIAAAFSKKEDSYRIYIEQLFRFFEKIGATTFLITETKQIPKVFSPTGVEEFLADGVVVLYSVRHENVKEHAIEILKLRGASHKKTIAAMQILGRKGIIVYPNQEIFSGLEEDE